MNHTPTPPFALHVHLRRFDADRGVESLRQPMSADAPEPAKLAFAGGEWSVALQLSPRADRPDGWQGTLRVRLEKGRVEQCSVALELDIENWSVRNYVLCPAAVYAGNRFVIRPMAYPPMYAPADRGLNPPLMMRHMAHLALEASGPSRIQLSSGDMSTPCIGVHESDNQRGLLLLTVQETRLGNMGLHLSESADRQRATLVLEAPVMRTDGLFGGDVKPHPCIDRAPTWHQGQFVEIPFHLHVFSAPRLQNLFDRFALVRKDMFPRIAQRQELPFSQAMEIQERKFNRDSWSDLPDEDYYTVGEAANPRPSNHWQLGWVGGGMSSLPLLFAGSELTRARACRTIDFIFRKTQFPSGLLAGMYSQGKFYGDGFRQPGTEHWVMTRKLGDGLYFILKHFILLQKQNPHATIPQPWHDGARRLIDRLILIWEKYHQFGQFMDYQTGELIQGGTTSGAILPAGLALAAQYFAQPRWLEVAQQAAEQYYQRDIVHGLTTAGPGEILSAPDSESSFAMLESFVVLYEITGQKLWRDRAMEMSRQFCTWVHSYDFRFPPDSPLGKLGMQTTGSVWANVQNKHSAPAICTLSGNALFKLWRATGDPWLLELARDIVHGTPQYLSRGDRPIQDLPDGWMCERVNTSDWEYNWCPPGYVFFGSCWCETSNMLSIVEFPGLYINLDLNLAVAFDHVEAEILERTSAGLRLGVANPTRHDATVRIMTETRADLTQPLGQLSTWGLPTLTIPAGQTVTYLATK